MSSSKSSNSKIVEIIKKKVWERINDLESQLERQMEVHRTLPSSRQTWSDTSRSQSESIMAGFQKKLKSEKKILDLLGNATKPEGERVDLYSLVKVVDQTKSICWYLISSSGGYEVEINNKNVFIISSESPIGKELIGLKKNDYANIIAPKRTFSLKILDVNND